MKSFFALLLIVTLLTFVFTGAYAVDEIQTELEYDGPYFAEGEEKPIKVHDEPVAILPEEPATLELGEKNGAPGNTPPPKPEFHRKMMYR